MSTSNSQSICRKFLITGQVQGVFFRASTQRQAEARGLTGHAVNLADGSVEVVACGEEVAVDQLERWLQKGPTSATVNDVTTESIDPQPVPSEFTTG